MVYGNEPLAVEEWLKKSTKKKLKKIICYSENYGFKTLRVSSSGFLVSVGKSFPTIV